MVIINVITILRRKSEIYQIKARKISKVISSVARLVAKNRSDGRDFLF